MDKLLREVQSFKNIDQKTPLNRVKSFGDVDFNGASGGDTFLMVIFDYLSCQKDVFNQ